MFLFSSTIDLPFLTHAVGQHALTRSRRRATGLPRLLPASLVILAGIGSLVVGSDLTSFLSLSAKGGWALDPTLQVVTHLKSAASLIYDLSSPLMSALRGNLNRRTLLILTMAVSAVSHMVSPWISKKLRGLPFQKVSVNLR